MERGYHSVTTAEIAQSAEVSVTTLFNYFPTKESLVFDEDQAMEAALVHAVAARSPETSILDAVRAFLLDSPVFRSEHEQPYADFGSFIQSTPELAEYGRQMWLRYEKTLAETIETSAKREVSEIQAEALAHYILEAVTMAQRFPKQAEAFNTLMDMLRDGCDI